MGLWFYNWGSGCVRGGLSPRRGVLCNAAARMAFTDTLRGPDQLAAASGSEEGCRSSSGRFPRGQRCRLTSIESSQLFQDILYRHLSDAKALEVDGFRGHLVKKAFDVLGDDARQTAGKSAEASGAMHQASVAMHLLWRFHQINTAITPNGVSDTNGLYPEWGTRYTRPLPRTGFQTHTAFTPNGVSENSQWSA